MRKYIKYAIISFFSLISCTERQESRLLKNEFMDSIYSYIIQDSLRHDSYIIFPAKVFFNENQGQEGMLVGPLYQGILSPNSEKNYIKLKGYGATSLYFYCNEIDFFDDLSSCQNIKYTQQDSVILYRSIYTKSPIINYLKRANLFFYKEKQLYKEQNVDSLFLPRIVLDEKTMLPIIEQEE